MNIDRLAQAVKDFEQQHGRKPAQVRVSNLTLRRFLAQTDKEMDNRYPVYSATIGGVQVITDWSFDDDKIVADWTSDAYGPTVQLYEVCGILRAWAQVYETELPTDSPYLAEERAKFRDAWQTVDLAISKSNLLARMFFSGDGLRRTPCPVHKGKWSGCMWPETIPCATDEYPYGCFWGANVTGWLPNPEVAAWQRRYYAEKADAKP